MTIYGNGWNCYHWTSSVNPISPIVKRFLKPFLRAWSTTDLYSNVCRLSDSEFDKLNSLFYFFIKQSIAIPRKRSYMACYLFCWERFSSISCYRTIRVFYPPWSLVVQCVDHLLPSKGESQINNKAVYVLREWLQFISATAYLELLRQISTAGLLLKKGHT